MRWVLFFATFTALYASMHFYVLWRSLRALALGGWGQWVAGLFMAVMVCTPFLVRYTERLGHEGTAKALAAMGYTWMGFLFLWVCLSFIEDGARMGLRVFSLVSGRGNLSWILPFKTAFFVTLLLAVLLTAYGHTEALGIRTERVILRTAKVPAEGGKLKVAQISDVHLGLMVREERLRRILDVVKAAEPDILVCTGDLVDGQMDNLNGLAVMLQELRPKYGKFAVTGNHEVYAGLDKSLRFITHAGFKILRNEAEAVLPWMTIAGVDDPAVRRYGEGGPTERSVLENIPAEHFTLLLKHRPFTDQTTIGLLDLQLSGHTHKGQIFPFTLIIKLMYPIDAGLLPLSPRGHLYVSRGSGTWGPPIRFLASPEVTLIELVHSGKIETISVNHTKE